MVTQKQHEQGISEPLVGDCDDSLSGHWRVNRETAEIEFAGPLVKIADLKPFEAIPLAQAVDHLGATQVSEFEDRLINGNAELRWSAPNWAQSQGIHSLSMVRYASREEDEAETMGYVSGEIKSHMAPTIADGLHRDAIGALRGLTPQILQTLPDPVFIFELGRGWIFVNPMAEELLTKAPDMVGDSLTLAMPKGFKRMMEHMHERVTGSGRVSRIEFYAKHRGLGLRWWSGLWSPLTDGNGSLKAVFVLHRDVSEQTELQGTLIRDRKKLQVLASTDPLTRLNNRRAFLDAIAALPAGNGQASKEIAILLFDVDHFKSVNDTHGHAVGDEVLKTIAAVTRQEVRAHDILARWGGEEFIICLPNTDLVEALSIAERLRAAISAEPIKIDDQTLFVSASFGVAMATCSDMAKSLDREVLINRADEALYQAKSDGRNRVCLAAADNTADVD